MGEGSITGIGQIHISVTDIDGAVSFYRDTVGLELLFTVPEQQMAFFDCGGVRLYLGVATTEGPAPHPLVYLATTDIGSEYDRLRDRGVEFIREPAVIHEDEATELWMAFFNDNEGRPIGLMEERKRHRGAASTN